MTDFTLDDQEEALRAVRAFRKAMVNNGIDREHALAAFKMLAKEFEDDGVMPLGIGPAVPVVPDPELEGE